jgi:probable FeS assembly SUF system protein SufT
MYFNNSEPISLYRDCKAVLIPDGGEVTLPQGSIGYITQSLGGSFTVYVEGNLFLIAGSDGDALGKEPVPPPTLPDNANDKDVENLVWEQLKTCFDPEIPINVVDLGLIYRCDLEQTEEGQRVVKVDMTLTAPGCGMGPFLIHDVRAKLELIPTIEQAQVELVFDPPWNQSMMSEAARLQTGMM